VNAIAPGVVDGEHWDGVDAFFAKYEGKAPGQKKKPKSARPCPSADGPAEDLTGMAVFLASDEADYIVAQTYNVDGGNG
jgi:NAD(P)-dependent dehydrogenase (short-subunit alcohol dehydrogenase family)